MTRRKFLQGTLLQGATLQGAAVSLLVAEPRGRLFDGKTLTGWKHHGRAVWTVEDGDIVGRFDLANPGPGYLFTEHELGDFSLELEFWISKGGNSGVYVRQPARELGATGDARPAHNTAAGTVDGVEVQIDYNDPKNYTGAIYDVQKPSKVVGAEERWNLYRITCEGLRVRVWINGELVNDYGNLQSLKGWIGLQVHGGKPHDHVVKFRNFSYTGG